MLLTSGRHLAVLGLHWLIVSVLAQECSKEKPCATGCCSEHGFCGTTEEHCGAGCLANCDFRLECDADNPCEIGCCSKFGFCGLGPDFCAEDICVAGCDRKGECDPGWGSRWSENSGCPLNVCCSDFGFCGTTKDFCGNTTVKHETCSKDSYLTRVVGYYEGWASRRPCHDFWPEQIPLGVYSHINFAFATIHPETYEVLPAAKEDVELYERLVSLKRYDKDLKVLIALGGWTFNDPGPTATVFSDLAASEAKQKKFFRSLISFMSTYGFDGVDLDWEYPEADDRNGRPEDYENFPKFMANLKKTLNQTPGRNELSITLPASYWYLQHFDLKALSKHVSFFNIMSYDMHGTWDQGNKWTGSYLNPHTNLTEIKDSLDLLWRNDVDSSQVVLGLAFYGRSYTVKGCMDPGCEYASGGIAGPCSHEAGVLLNNEIVDIVREKELSPVLHKDAAVKITHWDDQWVSYDDRETLGMKAEFARTQCLSGVMVWAISHDTPTADFSQDLAKVTNRQVTLQHQTTEESDYVKEIQNHGQCHWSNCGEPCPNNWKMVRRTDEWRNEDGEYMQDTTACAGVGMRSYCCPPEKLPQCGWWSFNNGDCKSGCPSGMVEVGSTRAGCKREEHQTACCTVEDDSGKALSSMSLYDTCEWAHYPECDEGKCSSSTKNVTLGASATGSGDVYCYPGDFMGPHWPKLHLTERKYCCDTHQKNRRFENCEWFNGYGFVSKGQRCLSGCPAGKMRVAMDSYNWGCYNSGARAYCCDPVAYTTTSRLSDTMQGFSEAMDNWLAEPSCVEETDFDSSLLRRDMLCAFDGYDTVVDGLEELLISFGRGKTDHITLVTDLWDKVKVTFPNLASFVLFPWIHDNATYPEYRVDGPRKTAKLIINFPQTYNRMAGEPETLWCPTAVCDTVAGFCNQEEIEEEAALSARRLEWEQKPYDEQRDVLHHLEKRANKKTTKFQCIDKEGKEQQYAITRWGYPGGSQWPLTSLVAQETVDLERPEDCSNTNVIERPLREGENIPKKVKFSTEHIVELKLIDIFLKWAMEDRDCEIDCDFIVDYLDKEIIENAPSLPGGNKWKKPLERIMEQLGTNNNKDVFRLVLDEINTVKGDFWNLNDNPGPTKGDGLWDNLVQGDDAKVPLQVIRDVIASFRYQALPKVQKRERMVLDGIRDELKRVEEVYKATTGKDIDLQECWDRFFKERGEAMAAKARAFVNRAISQLRRIWDPARFPDDQDWQYDTIRINQHLNWLELQQRHIDFSVPR